LAIVTVAYGFASGPPAGHTGGPDEQLCTRCHVGTPNDGNGSVLITGLPATYEPGQEVTVTVRVQRADRRRWGFQITALDSSNQPAGTFRLVDTNLTRIVNGTGPLTGRSYVEQTSAGTANGTVGGNSWTFIWVAPATDVGIVTFYAAGNAANGSGTNSGDNIYTTIATTGTATPVIIAPAFKKGKIVMQQSGSNIVEGAVLEVSGGALMETFPLALNKKGTKWVAKKTALSTPSGLTPEQAVPVGTTVTLVVRNPGDLASAPVQLTRTA
jgi:hypothetical protein